MEKQEYEGRKLRLSSRMAENPSRQEAKTSSVLLYFSISLFGFHLSI